MVKITILEIQVLYLPIMSIFRFATEIYIGGREAQFDLGGQLALAWAQKGEWNRANAQLRRMESTLAGWNTGKMPNLRQQVFELFTRANP